MKLRDYQEQGRRFIWNHIKTRTDNPCAVLPTGSGKTPLLSQLCKDVLEWKGRVIILSHVRELLSQSYAHLKRLDPAMPVGIYSAGLESKDASQPITVAGIQSACRNPDAFPPADIIIIDEAHRIPTDGEGQYRTFLDSQKAKNPNVRLIGLTATDYRMSEGRICTPNNLLNHVCYEVKIPELIAKGFLSPLKTKGPTEETDFSNLSIVNGDFANDELEALMNDDHKVMMAVADVLHYAKDRKAILIFACGLKHGAKIAGMLRSQVEPEEQVGEVYGETDSEERDRLTDAFRAGKLRWLINVNVLSIGFDAPNVDCVALMRATKSPGLYYQAVGRGFRISEGKKDCLVLDFGGNVLRHGPVDAINPTGRPKKESFGGGEAPVKKCPECNEYVPINQAKCECGYQWPIAKHEAKASDTPILAEGPEERDVESIDYRLNEKEKEMGISRTLRVDYNIGDIWPTSEFVCFEHKGYARQKAEDWWRRRANTAPPSTVDEALDRTSELLKPTRVTVVREGKYKRISAYKF